MLYLIVIVFSSREGTVAASVLPVVRTVREVAPSVAYHCYCLFQSRGNCNCECAPCGKDSEGGCLQCCISLLLSFPVAREL